MHIEVIRDLFIVAFSALIVVGMWSEYRNAG